MHDAIPDRAAFTKRPSPDEYDPFYATYVGAVPDGDVLTALETQRADMERLLASLTPEQAGHRYAEGKWSVREVAGHIADAERIFSYRALCIARGDTQPLPGMDQDDYMAGARFADRSIESLAAEIDHLRRANLALFASLGDQELSRRGTASGCSVTVRALVWIVAGHALHHQKVLASRYGLTV